MCPGQNKDLCPACQCAHGGNCPLGDADLCDAGDCDSPLGFDAITGICMDDCVNVNSKGNCDDYFDRNIASCIFDDIYNFSFGWECLPRGSITGCDCTGSLG